MLVGFEAAVRKTGPGHGFFRRMILRIRRMAAAWVLIGILVGVSNGIHVGGGALNLLTQVFAAAILFSMLGLLLGIVFDSRQESVVGSVIGLLVALFATLAGARIEVGSLASIGLAAGGIFGATVCPLARLVFRSIRCVKASASGRITKDPVAEDKESVFDGDHHLSLNRDEPFQARHLDGISGTRVG